MVLVKDKTVLSLENYFKLEKELYDKGFLAQDYNPNRILIKTTVPCPICGTSITTETCGNSYGIRCETEDCLSISARGI